MENYQMDGEVSMDPMPPKKGQDVTIYYAGPLAENEQDPLYVYVNYSTAANIEASKKVAMKPRERGLAATFPTQDGERIRFYFRSQNGNVDDNQGEGWESPLFDS